MRVERGRFIGAEAVAGRVVLVFCNHGRSRVGRLVGCQATLYSSPSAVSVKTIRWSYHIKGCVGVARTKMSAGRNPFLSNSRKCTKRPLTGAITNPLLPQSLEPVLHGPLTAR